MTIKRRLQFFSYFVLLTDNFFVNFFFRFFFNIVDLALGDIINKKMFLFFINALFITLS